MYLKVRVAGGDWFEESEILWEGFVAEVPREGGYITLNISGKSATGQVRSTGMEISDNNVSYIAFISPVPPFDSKHFRAVQKAQGEKKTT